ncbi:MAG: sulfotransferase [Rhodospirillales bacterium]
MDKAGASRTTGAPGAHPAGLSTAAIVLIGVVKIALILPAALADPMFGVTPDAGVYMRIAASISAGDPGWYNKEMLIAAPGYPLFLAALTTLGIDGNAGFVAVNAVLVVLTTLVYFDIARRFVSLRFALVAALIMSADPNLTYYQTTVLTEPLFALLVSLILWLLVQLVQDSGLSLRAFVLLALATGVLCAAALVVRHIMLLFPGFLIVLGIVQYALRRWTLRRAMLLVVVAGLPVMGAAEVWSQKNQEVFGIDGVRAFGQHLYIWRAPAIISRATGRDRVEIRDELYAAIPPGIEGDFAAVNAFQVEAFSDIAWQYPMAVLADIAEGMVKVMIAPAQAPLQTYFADAFGERLFMVDFIGFGERHAAAWSEFAAKAPGYLVLLAYSTVFVLAVAAGTGLAVVSLPQRSADKLAVGITLILLAAYFIVLSSSSSLDARFRTPFAGILAILATLGLRTFWYAYRDWYAQSGLRKYATIAFTIVRSGEPVAYLAAALKAARVLFLPLDFLLSLVSVRYDDDAARRMPAVIVIGNHRSGTTLVAQTLCQRLFVTPLANLSVLFPNAPVIYALARHWLRKPYALRRARNFYGFSAGLLGVSDVYEVWNRWFGGDRSHPAIEDRDEVIADLRRYFYTLYRAGGMPVLAKNNRATLHAGLLAEALPGAVFVCVGRDGADVVRSLLSANVAFYGDARYVWGLRPTPDFPRYAPTATGDPRDDAVACAARQQAGLEATIERELSALPAGRLVRVAYEDVTGPDAAAAVEVLVADVARRIGGDGIRRDDYPQLAVAPRTRERTGDDAVTRALAAARSAAT